MSYKTDVSLLQSVIDVVGFLILTIGFIIKSIIKLFVPNSYIQTKNFEGEIALITGGGSGLGRLLALRLAKLKAVIVLWDVNSKGVEETIKMVEELGGVAHGFKCDVSNRHDVYKVAEQTKKDVGDVTILINNAGILSGKLLLDTPDDLIQRTFEVNIIAHFWTVKAFLPKMIEKDRGHIVTIASMGGYVGIHKLVDYCTSKHAAIGFDESLRVELEQQGIFGIKTTVICPYFLQATGMFGNVDSRFLSTLKPSDVADRTILAMKKEETKVLLPWIFNIGLVLKLIVPWEVTSMFLRGLVPDAVPAPNQVLNGNNNPVIQHNKKTI